MRLTSVVLTSWISSITSKISWIAGWPWSNRLCVSVRLCLSVYNLIHGPQKQILGFFCLEIWILAWRSHGKIMELFLWEPWLKLASKLLKILFKSPRGQWVNWSYWPLLSHKYIMYMNDPMTSVDNFTWFTTSAISQRDKIENHLSNISLKSPMGQWVKGNTMY